MGRSRRRCSNALADPSGRRSRVTSTHERKGGRRISRHICRPDICKDCQHPPGLRRTPMSSFRHCVFCFLRSSTAVSSVLTGLLQTFVFARVLQPRAILVVRAPSGARRRHAVALRSRRHQDSCSSDCASAIWTNRKRNPVAAQTSAIVTLYIALTLVGAVISFLPCPGCGQAVGWDRCNFALFFVFHRT